MNLPEAFTQIFQKKQEKREVYLSLVLEESAVQAALWSVRLTNKPHISEATSERVTANAWDKRSEACDRAIARLAEKEGRDDFEKVVLGLPVTYLTPEDDIAHSVRPHIKALTEELELSPIGFVPIHQAIAHQIRQEEGVPPSVILIEMSNQESTLILYRVGAMVGKGKIENNNVVPSLEKTLKGFKDIEVLPSRILLYGGDAALLDLSQRDLLKHPWPTRANFLHYPKIDVLPVISLAAAVSLAGASELATQVSSTIEQPVGEAVALAPQDRTPITPTEEEILEAKEEENHEVVVPTEIVESGDISQEEEKEHTLLGGDLDDADANVTEVAPETLGFRHDVDILEHPTELRNKISLPSFDAITQVISGIKLPNIRGFAVPKIGFLALLVVILLIVGVGWLTYWVLPQAKVVVYQVPNTITESSAVTINPTTTVVDVATKIVPGRKQERTVNGDKTIAVTGKKDIGDPARGTVTVFNRSLSSKQLNKGTILIAGTLLFSIDSDVSVASASVGIDYSINPAKASAAITATKLGPQSNLPTSTEFSIKDTPTSVMIARNDAALSGGTSKSVTVVSRADYDAIIESLTKDLIVKAKTELSENVDGRERLIDETIKTAVTQKKFDQELDQESDKLHGSITVSVTGISYNADDVTSLFVDMVSGKVPSGYTLEKNSGTVSVSNVQVKKDGSIHVSAHYQGAAIPSFDLPAMKKAIAGKSTSTGEQYFRSVSGVGGIELNIMRTPWKTTFPVNADNISFTVRNLE